MTQLSQPAQLREAEVCIAQLHYRASAGEALAELAGCATTTELLVTAHRMWCGPGCRSTEDCTFLHYPRTVPLPGLPQVHRSRYNKDTAELYGLMGGAGYAVGTAQRHETDLWPLLLEAMGRADAGAGAAIDYTDWARKGDRSAAEVAAYACRDTLQWAAVWLGEEYARVPAYLHYVALSTVVDDLCVPPLDLVSGRFRLYGHSVGSVIAALEGEGWRHDAVHALLSLVRESVYQYAEKVDHAAAGGAGLHARLNDSAGVWDACVYRMHSANNYGCGVVVARVCGTGPVTFGWLMDSGMADAISMDLAKSALDVYRLDAHQPTAGPRPAGLRQQAYHSVYLDLIDDLVRSGAPEGLVHYGRAGLLYVQMMERYHERRLDHRVPLRPPMAARLRELFGEEPVEASVGNRFRAHRDGAGGGRPLGGPTGLGTSAARVFVAAGAGS